MQIPKGLTHHYNKKNIKIYLGQTFASAKLKLDIYRAYYLAEFKVKKSGDDPIAGLADNLNLLVKIEPDNNDAYDGMLTQLTDALEADGVPVTKARDIIDNAINPDSLTLKQCRNDYENSNRGSVSDRYLGSVLSAFDEFISIHGDNLDVSAVDRKMVSSWINDHIRDLRTPNGRPASLETKKKRVKSLSVIFGDLHMRGYVGVNPFSGASVLAKSTKDDQLKSKKRPWTKGEITQLLELGGKYTRLHPVIKILSLSGLRLGELWRVDKSDIDEGEVVVHAGKTKNAARIIPVHSELTHDVWSDFYRVRDEVQKGNMTQLIGRARKEIGIGKEVDLHSCRRYFATQLEQVGTPEYMAAAILGHARDSLSYDLYSAGPLLDQMRVYIDKVGI